MASKNTFVSPLLIRICLSMFIVMSVTGILIFTRSIMIPFVLALFLYVIIIPPLRFLEDRWKWPHFIAVLAFFLALILSLGLIGLLVTGSVSAAAENIQGYKERLVQLTEGLVEWLTLIGIEPQFINKSRLIESLNDLPIFQTLGNLTGKMMGIAANFSLVSIFMLFFLIEKPPRWEGNHFLADLVHKVRLYLNTKILTSLATGILTGVIFAALGLDFAFMFAIFAFFLNFIPNVGSIIAIVIPIPIAIIQFDSILLISLAILLPMIGQFILGNVVETKIMGKTLGLHPITLLVALMFWGLIWGLAGMILAAPLTVLIKVLLEKNPSTRPLAQILAGKIFAPADSSINN